jgi:hypothetical protein
MRNTTGRRRTVAVLAVLGLGGGLLAFSGSAGATESNDEVEATTKASLSAGAENQNGIDIECSWALEDVDSDWRTAMTYKFGPFWGDSTPNTQPEVVPCQGRPPTQAAQGTEIQIDVLANSEDEPTEQYVELWMAVDYLASPDSTSNPLVVDWEVYHPDGTLKFQVPARRYADCAGPLGMFDAAVATGQITRSAIGQPDALDPDTLLNLCTQSEKFLYYGAFPISKHQPWGEYTIVGTAEDNFGSDSIEYKINVLPFYDLRADFTEVSWPALTRDAHKRVGGDVALNTPARPTVVNRGNAGITVEVEYDVMCLVGFESQCTVDRKNIDAFDAAFGVRTDLLVAVGDVESRPNVVTGDQGSTPVPPNTRINFEYLGDTQPGQSLCPNDRGKVEFSLYTENDQETGSYKGAVSVYAVPLAADGSSYCPTDNGSVYYGDFPYNQYVVDPTLISNTHWGPSPA